MGLFQGRELDVQVPFKTWRPLEPEGDPSAAAAYATAEAAAQAANISIAGEVRGLLMISLCRYGTGAGN